MWTGRNPGAVNRRFGIWLALGLADFGDDEMATVVIIHAADDALPARALAEKLRAARLMPVLEKYGEEVRAAARGANAVIALWSPRSAANRELVEDVAAARGAGAVTHARMQNTPLPGQFRDDVSFDLTGWRGEDDFRPWRDLADAITTKAGVAPLPAAPAGGSAFFQPGRPAGAGEGAATQRPQAPRQQAPRQQAPRPAAAPASPQHSFPPRASTESAAEPGKSGSPVMMIVIGAIALAVLGGGAFFLFGRGGGTQAATAWEEVARNDATALRAFIAGSPGEFRDDAETALAELEQQSFDAAQDADTIEGFEAFLADFPDSDNAIAARGRIAELRNQPEPPTAVEAIAPAETAEPVDPDLLPPPAATAPNQATATTPETPGGPATIAPPSTPTEPAPQPSPN